MQRIVAPAVSRAFFVALMLATASAGLLRPAHAAVHDGNWSVLIITEKGGCDAGFRYDVNVANGRVIYQGSAPVSLSGTVAPNGQVKVALKGGDAQASGTGRLSGSDGAGTWRGAGSGGTCTGRWEAERR